MLVAQMGALAMLAIVAGALGGYAVGRGAGLIRRAARQRLR